MVQRHSLNYLSNTHIVLDQLDLTQQQDPAGPDPQMGDANLYESPEEEDNDSPGPDRENHSSSTEDWHRCPRKRTQTLPAFSCPLSGMAAKADALSRWRESAQESVEEKSGTLSEDIFKILDLRRSGPLFGGSQISTKEEDDRLKGLRGSNNTGSSTAAFQKPKIASRPPLVLPHLKSVGKLAVSGSVQQVNCRSEQKPDSQQLVESLQQENKELRARLAELQSALEADHRHVATLEICLRNAEHSRDEAQRSNGELQRQLQQFLTRQSQAPT